jgi:hypothetical protein
MKKFIKYILASSIVLVLNNCSKEEISRTPLGSFAPENTFTSYSGVQTYVWKLYTTLRQRPGSLMRAEGYSTDIMMNGDSPNGNDWLWQRVTVPTSTGAYTGPYQRIRDVNIMLDNLDASNMDEVDKNHWRSVGYFFRTFEYLDLLSRYGDVIWVERELTDVDTDILFGPRTPRDQVAQNMLDDLLYAEANIKEDGDGPNTIDVHCIRALISRFGLFEGTWRKYHSLGGEAQYLQASVDASEQLMAAFPSLLTPYDAVQHTEDLGGEPGIILYYNYIANQTTHSIHHFNRSSQNTQIDFTKAAADAFLCLDGRPRSTSAVFEGDQDPYTEFRNRDLRMLLTITPPYEVTGNIGGNISLWEHTGDAADREYMDLLEQKTLPYRTLPELNWAGFVQPFAPNFAQGGNPNGIPFDPGYNVTRAGYKSFKFYNHLKIAIRNQDETDEPIFRMGEILMNYAEAKFELGQFDQSVADATINALRTRANGADMAPMTVADIDASFDTSRDPDVDPVLWEIRRERLVELMAEGFRFDDLRRWKKMDYAAQKKLGRWVDNATLNAALPIEGGATAGYISLKENDATPPAFPDHYYLYPLPSSEILLNPQLGQNPGW